MKKIISLVLFLLILSCLSGYLMSKPSLVGRIGMDLFYKQYQFLKTWWQGALLVFFVWMLILSLLIFIQKKLSPGKSRIALVSTIVLALIGFYFTWNDFHDTNTHRWLKERFHIGAYLFWLGWILICAYLLLQSKPKESEHEKERRNPVVQDQKR